ncbi:MAG: hypothetical protein COZ34_03450 [Candidatus Pacebacteria bacterium CG_4_10_14_3_um_filter_34_15]|nr:MFS transporter [Candidatus Pacearchaeota archaeon]NCQ65381.1 MFS transporter [Candidatus Paceibacterota bacterium]OIO44236.1 MAG: hypothetical protein AUJ41_03585 [Candidatus Pacebacteria bacterium CG1_02_43_31]PIQ80765.1 MAG: hypothetical protein COV78_03665 [Candidatus Pacebacteria bacterium CG11_big_fil_rev_8_21_14_0_20_34_55]PIX81376.1 MAG: hypothetical protein COZ34_03450 [Candidatus Pacebacteria bacterium CG_4_10_14_3_um_filter_34_15]PJC43895.1 MAG: hypothetical protein CO039_01745 [
MFLKKFLLAEVDHFKSLSRKARALTWSILLYQLADVSTWIFMLAFIVQQSGKLESPAVFALGMYITMPLALILAAKLLRKYSLRDVSVTGLIGLGLLSFILFFLPVINFAVVFIFGLFYGIPLGLYWGTRSFLYTAEIANEKRDYVSGLTGSTNSIIGTTTPLIIGWLIALSPSWGWEKISSYRLLAMFGLCIFTLAGLIIKKHDTKNPVITKLWVKNPPKQWKLFRAFTFLGSMQSTLVLALPGALIITYIGDEGVLGTIISLISVIAGISLYILGRLKNASSNRTKILLFGLVPLILSSVFMLVSFNYLSILIYLIAMIIFDKLYWFVFFPIFYNQVEQNSDGGITNSYRLLFDHEIYINLGRIITTILYLYLIYNFDNKTAVSVIVMLAALSQIGILSLAKRLK